jgi:hypothetical protein
MPRYPRFGIWNTLHDGEITAVAADASDTVTIFVSIPYLRRRLQPLGDSFVLTLSGVRQLQFRDFSGTISSLPDELALTATEILSSESQSMPVTVETTAGQLLADFDAVQFALDTGQPVGYDAIEKACHEYWDEGSAKHKKA